MHLQWNLLSFCLFFLNRRCLTPGLILRSEFYNLLEETLMEYNILESDTCAWQDDFTGQFPAVPTAYTPGPLGCQEHLEQSFECMVSSNRFVSTGRQWRYCIGTRQKCFSGFAR